VVAAILDRSRANPLGMPDRVGEDLERLAGTFAPGFLIDVGTDADRIGRPVWDAEGFPTVDTSQPAAFVRLAHSWIDG
jgi:hypothetical protein